MKEEDRFGRTQPTTIRWVYIPWTSRCEWPPDTSGHRKGVISGEFPEQYTPLDPAYNLLGSPSIVIQRKITCLDCLKVNHLLQTLSYSQVCDLTLAIIVSVSGVIGRAWV